MSISIAVVVHAAMKLSSLPINQVLHGDCLDVLADMPDESIDLAYLDPPFNTGKSQIGSIGEYDDIWPDMASYLAFMRTRVDAIDRVLKPNGAILLHCDWRTCHHYRVMLEEIFGTEGFVNHLIWRYGLGGSSPRRFARKHDDILFYAKGDAYYFDPPRVPATSNRMRGMMKKACDVIDIPSINNMAIERVGYPTQKPIALMNMLVNACCPLNGIVLDPFCGSGTSLEAAKKSGRAYVGIDRSANAVRIARERCDKAITPIARTKRRTSTRSTIAIATGHTAQTGGAVRRHGRTPG
jgi:site-specific DNA-methyltransferase (adenine-specific)